MSRAAKDAERAAAMAKFSSAAPAPRTAPEGPNDEGGPDGDPSAGRTSAAAQRKRTKFRAGVDLYPAERRQLGTWCADAAFELGRPSVPQQHVFEALVKLLITDETLSRKVKAELRKRLEEQW